MVEQGELTQHLPPLCSPYHRCGIPILSSTWTGDHVDRMLGPQDCSHSTSQADARWALLLIMVRRSSGN